MYQAGNSPSASAHKHSAEKWLDEVIASLHRVTFRLVGRPTPHMKAQEIVDLSYALAQLETPQCNARIEEALEELRVSLNRIYESEDLDSEAFEEAQNYAET